MAQFPQCPDPPPLPGPSPYTPPDPYAFAPPGYAPYPYPPQPSPPRVWPCFVTVVCVFAGHLAAGIILAIFVLAAQDPGTGASPDEVGDRVMAAMSDPRVFLAVMSATVVVTFLGGALPALLSPVPFARRLRINPTITRWWQDAFLIVAGVALSWALASVITLLRFDRQGALAELDQTISQMRGTSLLVSILVIGILCPVAEEVLFRGYVQTRLKQRWGPAPAVLVAAALFALLHFDPIHSAFALGLGLILGYATERSQSLWPAIGGHALNNTVSVLSSATGFDDAVGAWVTLTAGAVATILCVLAVELTRPKRPADLPESPSPAEF